MNFAFVVALTGVLVIWLVLFAFYAKEVYEDYLHSKSLDELVDYYNSLAEEEENRYKDQFAQTIDERLNDTKNLIDPIISTNDK
jgi:hypothetical protein